MQFCLLYILTSDYIFKSMIINIRASACIWLDVLIIVFTHNSVFVTSNISRSQDAGVIDSYCRFQVRPRYNSTHGTHIIQTCRCHFRGTQGHARRMPHERHTLLTSLVHGDSEHRAKTVAEFHHDCCLNLNVYVEDT